MHEWRELEREGLVPGPADKLDAVSLCLILPVLYHTCAEHVILVLHVRIVSQSVMLRLLQAWGSGICG